MSALTDLLAQYGPAPSGPAPPMDSDLASLLLSRYGASPRGPIGDPTAQALLLGEKWPGADKQALAEAQRAKAAGMDRDLIWQKYGWGQTPEGYWVTESPPLRFNPKIESLISQDGRTKLPGPVEPDPEDATGTVGYSSARFPDQDVLLNDPTLQFPGSAKRRGMTTFETLGPMGFGFGAYDPERTGLATGTYMGKTGNPEKSIDIGAPRFPFLGLPLSAVLGTLVHEKDHEGRHLSGIIGPEPHFPGNTTMHRHLTDEQLAEASRLRNDLTEEERRRLPFWYNYTVPENLQIYYHPQQKRWIIPEGALSNPLGQFTFPANPEDWTPRDE